MKNIILYSKPGCPRCNVLRTKLEQKGIRYEEHNSVEEMELMESLGITSAPVLSVDGEFLQFRQAVDWVNEL